MLAAIKKIRKWPALPAVVLFLVLIGYNWVVNPGFLRKSTFNNYLLTSTPTLCVAMGVCACKIVGGIDISLGTLLGLINVSMAYLYTNTEMGMWTVLLIGLAIGLTGGLINGVCVGVLRINPLLATFATGAIFEGAALWIMPTPGGYGIPRDLIRFTTRTHFGFIPSALIFLAVPLIIWLVYINSTRGLSLYGVGGNEKSAYVSGMPVAQTKMFAHVFGGLCSTIGAIAVTGLIASGDPTIGSEFSLKAVAAVVIGGVALSGGEGDIWGGLFGGLFLTIILITIVSSKVSTFSQNFANYLILFAGLLLAVVIKQLGSRLKTRKLLAKVGE